MAWALGLTNFKEDSMYKHVGAFFHQKKIEIQDENTVKVRNDVME